ncbi:MAG: ribosome-associated translation inhibitor RaiA [Oscillospiraceae bacterium]|nr:ribosome-associated translation inhibitor RaiA [Oscillospiraceae bacterium]
MNITITARKTTIKDSFKERIEKKLAKFDRFFDDANATVRVSNEKDRETVEVTIVANGMIYRAERTTSDRAESLDAVVDVLFKQIVKNKSKLTDKVKAKVFDEIEETLPEEVPSEPIKVKKFPTRAMDVDEAILQMNLLGHEFFLFQNSATGSMNVVYRRHGDSYGLIEPVE